MRMAVRVTIIIALAAISAPLIASAKDAPIAALSDKEKALVNRAIDRGELMYAYDQAAWHGTDDIRVKLPDFASKVEGWIVDGSREAPHLIFYGKDKDNPKAVYVADFRDNHLVASKVLLPNDDAALTPDELKLIDARRRARDALAKSNLAFCAKAMPNSIVLPPEGAGGPYLVYFMTPQTSNDSVPLGGHYLFEVAADGRVGEPRPFTKSCMELPVKAAKGDKPPAALFVTHLLDPTPTEIHVFTTFAARLPVYVMTAQNRRVWATGIASGRATMRLVDVLKK